MIDLKPCPFCGGEAEVGQPVLDTMNMVFCVDCKVTVEDDDVADAIAAWNRRAPLADAAPEMLEVLRLMTTEAFDHKHGCALLAGRARALLARLEETSSRAPGARSSSGESQRARKGGER